jgi:short-subunit dehydrogenase
MKRILVLGATSAIAERSCRIWAQQGAALYLVGRDPIRLQSIADDLRVRGAVLVGHYALDLNHLEEHSAMHHDAKALLGGIDVALIAHGSLPDQAACEQSVEKTLAEIQTNALSTIALLTLLANAFEEEKKGTIAVISSVAGDRGRASNYVYGSSKALVTAFASGLRQRLFKSNVSVVTIKPGFVDTPMTAHFKKGLLWAKPESVANGIVRAIGNQNAEIYVPGFWWLVMTVIQVIPTRVFRRLRL